MKLLVNINSLIPPLSGVGRYTLELLKRLLEAPEIDDIWGAGAQGILDRVQLGNLLVRLDSTALDDPSLYPSILGNPLWRRWARHIPGVRTAKLALENIKLGKILPLRQYIYWEPNYLLMPYPTKAVVTVHDLSHIDCPEYHPQSRVAELKRHLSGSLHRARHVLVVSEFTKKRVVEHFDIREAKISVIPRRRAGVSAYDPAVVAEVRARYGLGRDYILSVGTLEPRKNIPNLLRAYTALPTELRNRYELLIVGANGWKSTEAEAMLSALEGQGVRRLGFINQKDLPVLYAGAVLAAYVPFYEGFGMPVAEALATGLAVMTSKRTPMADTAGDAAYLVDPDNVDSIRAGLAELLTRPELRAGLAARASSNLEATVAYRCCPLDRVLGEH